MLNTEMLTKVDYLNLLEESDISFTEIDLIPETDYSDIVCFRFEDKNIDSSCIKVKAFSDEYPHSIEHILEFEDCNINDLSILIENYLGGFRLNNCKVETLTIYKPKDRSLPEITFESTRAKVINIIETEAIDKNRDESRIESKRITLNFRTETRDQEESNYNIINSIIYTGYDTENTKNRLKIISKLYTNTLIENLYLNNVSYDDISIEDQISTNKVSQSEFIINNIYLDNVTFTDKRNLVYRNIRIDSKELLDWMPLQQKLLNFSNRRPDYPRHDVVSMSLFTTALTELLSCDSDVTDFEIQNLNRLGVYPINQSSSGIIQLLRRTKETGQKVVNKILRIFEKKFHRNILRSLSSEITNKHSNKITLYPEDIAHINSCINKVLKTITGLDLNVIVELNSKGEVNLLNIDRIPKEYTITSDHWLKGISGLRQNGPIRNPTNEIMIDPDQVVSFSRRSPTDSNFAEMEAQMRVWQRETNRAESNPTTVLDSMRTTDTNNIRPRPAIQSRQRIDTQPVFRVTPALRGALSEPEVTPNNFDPAFLDNRTQARQAPIETEEPQNSNPMSFREAAEAYRNDTTAIANALDIEESMRRELHNFNSQYHTQFTTIVPEEYLTATEILERQRRESSSQGIINAYERILSGGYSISEWNTQNVTNFEHHFMPRDPISSIQMNVEDGTMRTNTESLDINIFSNSDDED